jgi:hypothetical protein
MRRGIKNMKAKKIFTNIRVIIMLVCLVLALIAIHPNPWASGLAIRSVAKNSSASIANMQSPDPTASPMSRERITAINNKEITSLKDYYDFTSSLKPNQSFTIKSSKNIYRLTALPKYNITYLNETEEQEVTEPVFNATLNQTINTTKTIVIQKTRREVIGVQDVGLNLYEAPTNNLKKGLDLSGGSRIVLKPKGKISQDDLDLTIDNINQRLNVFGLTDVNVRPASDLQGDSFIIIEIAGTTKEELTSLAKQGNFEAKIGNNSAFKGGKDITYICRTPECSGIDPRAGCSKDASGGSFCRFRFSITLTPEAAQRQADLTKNLDIVVEQS